MRWGLASIALPFTSVVISEMFQALPPGKGPTKSEAIASVVPDAVVSFKKRRRDATGSDEREIHCKVHLECGNWLVKC